MLARSTTLFALLDEYPFLEGFLVARHAAFGRLARPGGGRGWARVVTLDELATAMNVPWREFLRELRVEVQRATGAAPVIAEDAAAGTADPRLQDALREALRDLEAGASLGELAARLDRETQGLDAEQVAVLARGAALNATGTDPWTTPAARGSVDAPATRLVSEPRAPREGLASRRAPGCASWLPTSRSSSTVSKVRRAPTAGHRRARLWQGCWRAWPSSSGRRGASGSPGTQRCRAGEATPSPSSSTRASARLWKRCDTRVAAVEKGDVGAAVTTSRPAISLVLGTLAAEEELLVPVALQMLGDDDWEAVAEQERVVGWALARD